MTANETIGKWPPDWRDPASYAYMQHLTREGWAWKFLRRNAAYARIAARMPVPPTTVLRSSPLICALDPVDTTMPWLLGSYAFCEAPSRVSDSAFGVDDDVNRALAPSRRLLLPVTAALPLTSDAFAILLPCCDRAPRLIMS